MATKTKTPPADDEPTTNDDDVDHGDPPGPTAEQCAEAGKRFKRAVFAVYDAKDAETIGRIVLNAEE